MVVGIAATVYTSAMAPTLPRLYTDHAAWFHLLTAPEDYAEESAFYTGLLRSAATGPCQTLLELGSGGGNMASHYVKEFDAVLTDVSPAMLALSRTIHPDVEHVVGDMRSLRLGRTFDAVLVHDAVDYMLGEDDLRQAMTTAYVHLRPGGVAVFAPDHTQENYRGGTDHGGHDAPDGRGLRYLEWCHPAEPGATTCVVDYALVFHEPGRPPRVDVDRHVSGLFSRDTWLRLLREVGFRAAPRLLEHSEVALGDVEVFVAVRPE
jgi:SAM-dependent methyltransferase